MEIIILDETSQLQYDHAELITQLLQHAAKVLDIEEHTSMSVTIVDNAKIQEINAKYRNKNQPTDVISFAMEDDSEMETFIDFEGFEDLPEDLPRDIGDIFISIERTREQAEEYNHSFERELGFLAVHGFLHLNGYDHHTEEEEKEMFTLQGKILEGFGLER